MTLGDQGQTVPDGSEFLQPALSGDGRYLAYVVTSDAVITGDTNGVPDVVVRERATGRLMRVSVASDGAQANGASGWPRISASGRYVAFWSEASTLVAGDTNGVRDVFVHDRDADGNGVFDETTPGRAADDAGERREQRGAGRWAERDQWRAARGRGADRRATGSRVRTACGWRSGPRPAPSSPGTPTASRTSSCGA